MTGEDRWRRFIDKALRKGKAVSAAEMAVELAVELYGDDSEEAIQAAKDTARECGEAGLLTICRNYWHITVTETGRDFVGQKTPE